MVEISVCDFIKTICYKESCMLSDASLYRDVRLPPRVIVEEPGTIKRGWPLYKGIIEHTCIYMRVVPMYYKIVSLASYRTGYKISEIFRILSSNFFRFLKFLSFRLLQNFQVF